MPLRDADDDDEFVEDTTKPVLRSDKRIVRGEVVRPGLEPNDPRRSEARLAVVDSASKALVPAQSAARLRQGLDEGSRRATVK